MRPLDKKLIRDVLRMWAQALAIALVMAGGVATLIMAVGAYRSLDETRAAYYERHRFADLFALLTRAPTYVADRIAEIPGVAAAETRIVKPAILTIENVADPLSGLFLSLPDRHPQRLNSIHLVSGRTPEPDNRKQVVVLQTFAQAHRLQVGSHLTAQVNDRKLELEIVGTALSPEYIYAVAPGELFPDDRRFAVIWMSEKALGALFDMEGMFNAVSVKLLRGAREEEVTGRLDDILARFGGRGAYPRKDQQSHAFLDAELRQLSAMSAVLPPIFLLVSAFLINMTLARLIDLEREQIGLLKALGYGATAIAGHYLKLALVVASAGIIIGSAAGAWLGRGITRIYADFFHFPFLIFEHSFDLYAMAAAVTLAAAAIGTARSAFRVMRLEPAVAMSPPMPTRYRRVMGGALGRLSFVSQLAVMVARHILRWPARAAIGVFGVALAVAILIASLFGLDSIEFMIGTTFFRSDRQDATVAFTGEKPLRALHEVKHMPGVLAAEPYRTVDAKIGFAQIERRIAIIGYPPGLDLKRVLDVRLRPVTISDSGITLSEKLADILKVERGDRVTVRVLEGHRRVVAVPVTAIIQSYVGLAAYMEIGALNRLMQEDRTISGSYVALDTNEQNRFFRAVKNKPGIEGITLHKASLAKFRETIAEHLIIMITVYITLAVLIAFGVVYSSARIQLSERTREFASLRVLGFTRTEVSKVLVWELGILVLAAIPLGWLLGAALAWVTAQGFDNEIYRMPFVISRATFTAAALVIAAAALVSALIVRRGIDRLDLIATLKARE